VVQVDMSGGAGRYASGVANDALVLLDLGTSGASLKVSARRQPYTPPGDEPWFDCEIAIEAAPLVSGTLSPTFTLTDLKDWAQSLEALGTQGRMSAVPNVRRRVVLGGNRAAELRIEVDDQQGGDEDALAVCIEATPSGDDPYPFVRYLIFDVAPFWRETRQHLRSLIGG
jgi:hypothetical protein